MLFVIERTVALKMNRCYVEKSKAQSNPRVMETLKSLTKALEDPTHAHQINADFCIINSFYHFPSALMA